MSTAKQSNETPQGLVLQKSNKETARCAFSETGDIVFATSTFYDLVGLQKAEGQNTRTSTIHEIFLFEDENGETFPDAKTLKSGAHSLKIRADGSTVRFQLDWLETPDQRRYLVASQLDKSRHKISPEDAGEMLSRINRVITTGEKETESTASGLIRQQSELLLLMGMTQDIMLVLDHSGNILRANNTFLDRIGYRSPEIDGLSFIEMFSADDRQILRTHLVRLKRALERNAIESTEFEARITARDGQTIWCEWSGKSFRGKIYLAGRDITDIKDRQDDLYKREKQLSDAEAIGRMGHWRWDISGDDISWSNEVYNIFGVDPNHFQPTLKRINEMVHRQDIARVIQAFQRAIIEKNDYDMEFRITCPTGEVRYIFCVGRCEKNEEGEPVALYGILQDMTERILYERELRAAKEASEQAYAAKTRFLANMSHELRTPLNAIIGFSEMIEHQLLGPVENKKYTEYATGIRESGEHLLDLISDILDMSKIEAGKYNLDLSTVRVDDVIKAAIKMVRGRAEEGKINLDIAENLAQDITLVADARALKQIILNLLTNAVKFTKEGGSVWMECAPREEHLAIKISDTGIGIPPNKLASVLRPFEQVSSYYKKDFEGTGLGLSITKELVELHGGSMHIESTVDIGTSVTVRLPYDASKHCATRQIAKMQFSS
ncbi:MAG: PAS domain-containing protein [Alphaproteobacteria bacterium]|nr:PAS domain-containing protein [Alphaproteobacteria bacterium]MCB9975248.1 PAS domain-containing protein [Rhodospirillales bacterium]